MRRLTILVAGLILVIGGAAPAFAGHEDPVDGVWPATAHPDFLDEAFLLTGTDAAIASFEEVVDSCYTVTLEVFFVQAKNLQSPLGSGKPRFHSDVETFVNVFYDCEGQQDQLALFGGTGVGPDDQVSIERLESAALQDFQVLVTGDGVSATVEFDLEWTGLDNQFIVQEHDGGHLAGRRETAAVSGTVEISVLTGTGGLVDALAAADIDSNDVVAADLTVYQEIVITP
jgi:hypothetical protein